MSKKFDKIYQFKISLVGIEPAIWRRIQVPETYTFWDLHVAIQDAIGWLDCHLHHFIIKEPNSGGEIFIGIPDDEWGDSIAADWETPIADYFSMKNKKAIYEYDFGDSWEHIVLLEKILPCETKINYPVCIAGERACPPEDCGGVMGYENLLEIMKNSQHEDYENMVEWLGDEFEPEHFQAEKIRFCDPKECLKERIN